MTPMSSTVAALLNIRHVSRREPLPSTPFVLNDCLIGVEMELEGDTTRALSTVRARDEAYESAVIIKEDGSLRDAGVELVFDGPRRGEEAARALDYMFDVKERFNLSGSFRTSTHVHVNYADLTDTAGMLGRSVAIFLMIEKAAAVTCGVAREFNSFCVPSYMTSLGDETVLYDVALTDDGASTEHAKRITSGIGSTHRYAAMNLAALFKFGTIEYRLLGTASREVTYNWINLLLEIKKASSSLSRSHIMAHESFLSFIRAVLPTTGDYLVYDAAVEQHYRQARARLLRSAGTTLPRAYTGPALHNQ